MTPEQQHVLQGHIQAIAKILYEDTPPEQLRSLAGIESVVRSQMQKHVMPQRRCFFITTTTGTSTGYRRRLKSILGELPIASLQAQKLAVQQQASIESRS